MENDPSLAEDFAGGSLERALAGGSGRGKKAPAKGKATKAKSGAGRKKKPLQAADTNVASASDVSDAEMDVDMKGDSAPKDGRSVEQIYQKKSQLEHILLRPDTYVGSVEKVTQPMWVFDDESSKLVYREVTFVPGLYKIFDEIIVNAADNKQRDSTMNMLKVTVDAETGRISVWNNGSGIPVVMHSEHKVYIPELIFGHLLTGSNFDDNQKKTTGGRNGYGAKLANIFSTEFIVETCDSKEKKKYKQVFRNNMGEKGKPEIGKGSKDFTCISFTPDFERFGMDGLDKDIIGLIKKRVYDMAGITDKSLKVFLNDEKLEVRSFQDYVKLYQEANSKMAPAGENADVIFESTDRWEVGVTISDGSFQQVSFVNAICTTKGGQHVNYIADQVAAKLIANLKKKNKGVTLKPSHIKNHLSVFVNALIENPAFDSQTKETLTTRPSAFGTTCQLSDKFLKKVEKCGIVEQILSWAKFKQNNELKRKSGTKKSKLVGIAKLDDANHAGSAKGKDCTLILTEGDSAKSLAVSGLSVVGRDYYGVFPLKGKLLNVREASHAQILKNEEIQNLVKIMGLKFGQKYEDTKGLRYGHIMIMTDQDHDGSHIKGLLINFIHHFWPSLLLVPNFLQEFITPIVKATKGKKKKVFYSMPEYEEWKKEIQNEQGWSIKYYKGLGTSTAQEAREYFSDLKTHQIDFEVAQEQDADAIDMAFSKKRVEDRKQWLNHYEAGDHIDYEVEKMEYTEFINKELILFSMADNVRSIPCMVDGFKPSQRKVLYGCFKRNLKGEIKVAQLAGYVSEHSAYHHGEMSLSGTIVNMAQDYVGSNNINILHPSGQFGTRLLGGKDSASARYIFTKLETITRLIFHQEDDAILDYLNEDGQIIEPKWYAPILPMVLVNGSDGIGTGWSSYVPNYNPRDIIKNLRSLIKGEDMEDLVPWYRGFTGQIERRTGPKDSDSFTANGRYEVIDDDVIRIVELPLRTWTTNFKQFLETLLPGASEKSPKGVIKEFKDNSTDTTVDITITLLPGKLAELEESAGGVMKAFKLETTISTSNMHMFDAEGHIKKYSTPNEVLAEFAGLRTVLYQKRKDFLLKKLEEEWKKLKNKVRFILDVTSDKIRVNNRPKADLMQELSNKGFDQILPKKKNNEKQEEETENEEAPDESAKGYDYLLSMKLWSLTMEKVQSLKKELEEKEDQMEVLRKTTPEEMWLTDLDALEENLGEFEENHKIQNTPGVPRKAPAKSRKKAGKKASGKRALKDEFDEMEDSDSDYEEAASKKPVKKTSTKVSATRKAAAAKPPKVKEEKVEVKAEEEMSLFDRMRARMMQKEEGSDEDLDSLSAKMAEKMVVSPPPVMKAKSRKKAPTKSKAVDSGSEDDIFAFDDEQPKKSTAKSTKAKATPKKTGKAATKRGLVKKEKVSPEKKKSRTSLSGNEDSDSEQSSPPVAVAIARGGSRRTGRAKKAISYADSASEEEDDVFDEEASDFDPSADDDSDFEC